MDNNTGGTGKDPREELRDQLNLMGKAAGELLEQLVKVPATLAQIPLQVMPEDASSHARNAAREGFEAVRTILDAMAKGIEQVMKDTQARANSASSTTTPDADADTTPDTSSNGYSDTATTRIDSDSDDDGGMGGTPTTRLDF